MDQNVNRDEVSELTFEIDIPIDDALENIKSYRRVKKSRLLGLTAFILAMLAGMVLLASMAIPLMSFLKKSFSMSDFRIASIGIFATAVLALAALVLSIVTYFRKKQKKGFAVAATVISVLLLLVSCAAVIGYYYVFGSVTQDEAFNRLSKEALYVVEANADGEVNRENSSSHPTLSAKDIENFLQQKEDDNPNQEVEWENLTNEDIPQEALDKMNSGKPQGKSYLTGNHKDILNFALFGLDESGASDSIMIFSVDKVHHKLKLISIPRDSYIKVPAWGSYAKLAYPYFWGGAEWAVGTLNFNFAMNVTEYIAVDMDQLADIIDLVGGVYVYLNADEAHCLRQYPGTYEGRCLLSGKAAVSYVRLRQSSGSDNEIKRTGRQREVLSSIMEQLQSLPWDAYPEFIRTCLGMCTTSFENEQLLELCAEVVQNNYSIEEHALIDYVDYWGGKLGNERYFYVVYDLNRASDQLYRLIYEDLYISGYSD